MDRSRKNDGQDQGSNSRRDHSYTYNRACLVAQAIRNVLNRDQQDLELVVMDNESRIHHRDVGCSSIQLKA